MTIFIKEQLATTKTDKFVGEVQKFILQSFIYIEDIVDGKTASRQMCPKNSQYDFLNMKGDIEGPGVKGRLELLQKLIRFGRGRLP